VEFAAQADGWRGQWRLAQSASSKRYRGQLPVAVQRMPQAGQDGPPLLIHTGLLLSLALIEYVLYDLACHHACRVRVVALGM
jgi:hypothetical protein